MGSFSIREEINQKIAILDIGSNTLLLTIVDCENGKIRILEDKIEIARLGENLKMSGIISSESLNRALRILHFYNEIIARHKPKSIIAMATAAIREANNGKQIKSELESVIGSKLSILPAESEALISYYGSFGTHHNGTLIDIGGGSTEFAYFQNGRFVTKSIPIGAVKIKEMFLKDDPANEKQLTHAREYIRGCFDEYQITNTPTNLHAVAGTPVTLASIDLGIPGYDFDKIHDHNITSLGLDQLMNTIEPLDAEQLRDILHVHPHRSDIIVAGSLILHEYIKYSGLKKFTVNCLGLRFGPLAIPNTSQEYNDLFPE